MENGELSDDPIEETPAPSMGNKRKRSDGRPSGRRWCFTLNNPQGDLDLEEAQGGATVRYGVWQREKAPETGTIHLQGYIEFERTVRLSHCKKLIPRAHWELSRGTRDQARDYCMKADSRDPQEGSGPHEYGQWERGGKGKRNDLLDVKDLIDKGAGELQIAQDFFGSWCRNYRAFARYRTLQTPSRDWATTVIVKYGPPGTGKSRDAMAFDRRAYWKPRGEWWDGYEGQEVVVVDDYYGWLPWDTLLRLCDRYPLMVETKGGFAQATPQTIIFTTNKPPHRWYDRKYPWDAFERRVAKWERYVDKFAPPTVYTGDSGYLRMMIACNDEDYLKFV